MEGTPSPVTVSTKLQKVAKLAREAPGMAITSLSHHIDIDPLHEAYRLTRKDGAVGVDGQTAKDYEENLHENLGNLLNRFKSGSYKAPPVRRVYIPKGDGTKTRPIGIPTFEDKVLQRAVTMLLEAVYEHETRGQPLSAPGEAWEIGKRLNKSRKLFIGTRRVANPVRQVCRQPEPSVAWQRGNP